MKKSLPIIATLVALAATGIYRISSSESSKPAPQAPAFEVAVLTLTPKIINREQSLPGRIVPVRQSEVRPQVDGIITRRLFTEGAEVKKGQQLYQIDDARYIALFQSAQATLLSAKTDTENIKTRLERFKELLKTNAISQQTYDDLSADFNKAKATVAVAQANVDLARVNLSYTKVYAPITGHVSRSYVSEGGLVAANQSEALAIITQLDPVYVDMQQTGVNDFGLNAQITQGKTIPIHLLFDRQTGTETYTHEGTLQFSEVTMDESTASTVLRALVPNPEGQLLPGMFVRTLINLGAIETLLVPQRATTRTPTGSLKVWILDADNKAQPREIKVEGAYADNWLLIDGLHKDDKLIVEGYQKIHQGQELKFIPWIDPHAPTFIEDSPAAEGK